jgi:hypothetical protein
MSQDNLKPGVDVTEATHVEVGGHVLKIASTWGISSEGKLAKPSEGGFGVVTEDGQRFGMWEVNKYLKQEDPGPRAGICPACLISIPLLNKRCRSCGKEYTHCDSCGGNYREVEGVPDMGLSNISMFGPVTFCDGCGNPY